jgi:type I restriction enzyme, S subunit
MEDRLAELPKGWARARIIDLVGKDGVFIDGDWVETKDQDPNGGVRLIQLADIGDGFYRNRSNRFLTKERAIQLNCTFLQPNDVLIARMPDPLGRACIFPGDPKRCVTAVDVCIVRPSSRIANNWWLMHTINAVQFRSEIESLQSGSTRKRISRSNLAKLLLPLSPLPEQHRIVAKIEELFTRLDAGVEALKKIKAQLKRYRQAVLKYAFEGKLTQVWRETNKGKIEPAPVLLKRIKEERKKEGKGKTKEMPPVDTSELPELPEEWVWVRIGEILDTLTDYHANGSYKKLREHVELLNEQNYAIMIRTTNLENSDFKTSLKYISESAYNFLQKSKLLGGEIIIGKIGNAGKVYWMPNLNRPCSLGMNMFLLRFNENILTRYVYSHLLSPFSSRQINSKVKGVGNPTIDKLSIRSLLIALPSLTEQQKIVEEIESRLSIADNMEKVAEQSLKQSERLRQSILKQAFEGKLVPQDPTDEPAEKLLDRIKEEKAKREAENRREKKHRNKNTKQMELI